MESWQQMTTHALAFARSGRAVVLHLQYRATMASDWTDAIIVTRTSRGRYNVYARKLGKSSEAAGDMTWTTVGVERNLKTPGEVLEQARKFSGMLDVKVDEQKAADRLAKLNDPPLKGP